MFGVCLDLSSFPALKIFLVEQLTYESSLMIKLLALLYFVVTKSHWADASLSGFYIAKRSSVFGSTDLIPDSNDCLSKFTLAKGPRVEQSSWQRGKQQWSIWKLGMAYQQCWPRDDPNLVFGWSNCIGQCPNPASHCMMKPWCRDNPWTLLKLNVDQ